MLLAVEGGGLFSASASGYSKGLTLLFSGDKDGDRPMRVVPWNRVSRGCASFSCFGGAPAGPLKVVEPSPDSEKGKDPITEAATTTTEAFKLSLRSSLKRPSLAESRSLEDIQEYETFTLDATDLTADMARRKVQWPDACGSELTQVREFEPSEMGLSDEEWEAGQQRTCSCVIM